MKVKFIYVALLVLSPYVMAKNTSPLCLDGLTDAANAAIQPLANVVDRLPAGGCPNIAKLSGICGDVFAKTPDNSNPEEYSYAYEKKIYEAACIDFQKDSSEVARIKLAELWDKHQEKFRCSSVNFSVTQGNILKYAVEMKTYGFIDNAVKTWKLNLNHVDPSDRQTLLDFVQFKLDQNKGNANEPVLRSYFDKLRRNGAKLSSELVNQT